MGCTCTYSSANCLVVSFSGPTVLSLFLECVRATWSLSMPFLLPFQSARHPSTVATAMDPKAMPAIAPAPRAEVPFSDAEGMGTCDISLVGVVGGDTGSGILELVGANVGGRESGVLGIPDGAEGLDELGELVEVEVKVEVELDAASLMMKKLLLQNPLCTCSSGVPNASTIRKT